MVLFNGLLVAALSLVLDADQAQVVAAGSAVALVVVAAVVWLLDERVGDGILDAGIAAAALIGICSVWFIDEPQWQMFIGFSVLMYAVYAAYFRPREVFLLEGAGLLVGYGFVVVLADVVHPMYLLAIMLTTVAVSLTVAVLVDQLREQARTDLLTRVLNRRGMQTTADHLRAFSQRTGQPISVGLVDIDDFKRFNDEYGHLAGDDRLVSVASGLVAGLRNTDVVARFGGDEFGIVLPGVDAGHAIAVLERIRDRTGSEWSFGVSEWHPGEPLERALSRADENLYASKNAA